MHSLGFFRIKKVAPIWQFEKEAEAESRCEAYTSIHVFPPSFCGVSESSPCFLESNSPVPSSFHVQQGAQGECRRLRLYKCPVFRIQSLLLLFWSATFRCIFKNKTVTEQCLAPWGNCSLFFPNWQCSAAGNRQPGVSSNTDFKIKRMQTKGQKWGGREGGKGCRDTGMKQVKKWRQRANEKIWAQTLERGE